MSTPTDATHPFIPARPGQSRSPCPALNALANHGYLPRSGCDITLFQLIGAVTSVYNVSIPLASILSFIGIVLCGSPFRMSLSLHDLAAHGKIEHDGSLVHADAPAPSTPHAPVFAPTTPDPIRLATVLNSAGTATATATTTAAATTASPGISLWDLASVRAERDRALWADKGLRLGHLHRPIAMGEVALAWSLLRDMRGRGRDGDGAAIPVEWARVWFGEERLPEPEGWVRPGQIGLVGTDKIVRRVRAWVNKRLAGKAL